MSPHLFLQFCFFFGDFIPNRMYKTNYDICRMDEDTNNWVKYLVKDLALWLKKNPRFPFKLAFMRCSITCIPLSLRTLQLFEYLLATFFPKICYMVKMWGKPPQEKTSPEIMTVSNFSDKIFLIKLDIKFQQPLWTSPENCNMSSPNKAFITNLRILWLLSSKVVNLGETALI